MSRFAHTSLRLRSVEKYLSNQKTTNRVEEVSAPAHLAHDLYRGQRGLKVRTDLEVLPSKRVERLTDGRTGRQDDAYGQRVQEDPTV